MPGQYVRWLFFNFCLLAIPVRIHGSNRAYLESAPVASRNGMAALLFHQPVTGFPAASAYNTSSLLAASRSSAGWAAPENSVYWAHSADYLPGVNSYVLQFRSADSSTFQTTDETGSVKDTLSLEHNSLTIQVAGHLKQAGGSIFYGAGYSHVRDRLGSVQGSGGSISAASGYRGQKPFPYSWTAGVHNLSHRLNYSNGGNFSLPVDYFTAAEAQLYSEASYSLFLGSEYHTIRDSGGAWFTVNVNSDVWITLARDFLTGSIAYGAGARMEAFTGRFLSFSLAERNLPPAPPEWVFTIAGEW